MLRFASLEESRAEPHFRSKRVTNDQDCCVFTIVVELELMEPLVASRSLGTRGPELGRDSTHAKPPTEEIPLELSRPSRRHRRLKGTTSRHKRDANAKP